MTGQDALWSALEVRTQAEQCPGQVTVWEALAMLDEYEGHDRPKGLTLAEARAEVRAILRDTP